MKYLTRIGAVLGAALIITGCFGGDPGPDLGKVLDRTAGALNIFQGALKKANVTEPTDQHMTQLSGLMQRAMNFEPPVYKKPIGVKLLKDATFEGFLDKNKDNKQDAGEKRLFKVEIDFEGKRLIATGEKGRSTGMGLATGFFAGMLMGRLLGSQRAAGVRPGRFANRKIQSRSNYARSRARSGGFFRGK